MALHQVAEKLPREAKRRAGVTQLPNDQPPRQSVQGPAPPLTHRSPAATPWGHAVEDTRGLRERLWEAGKGPHFWLRGSTASALSRVCRACQPQEVSLTAPAQTPRKRECREPLPGENQRGAFRGGIYLPGNPSLLEFPSSISPEKQRRRTGGNERSRRVQTARKNTGDVSTTVRPPAASLPPTRQSPQERSDSPERA